jgi:hypothetical protein
MEKIQIEKTIKKFNEFSEDEQEEILNNYRDINVDFDDCDDWNDYILIDFIEEVKKETDLEIESDDLIWEVGDRNSKFGVYSKNIVNQLIFKFEDKGVYDIETTEKLGSFLNHLGGGICRQRQTESGLAQVYFEEDTEEQAEQNKAVIEQINNIIDTIIELCSKYYTKNEEAYNYAISDEAVRETIEANDYDFDIETLRIY